MSKKFIRSQMNEDVKAIAEMDKFEMRQKDIALSPVLLTPLILVPGTLSNLFIVLSPLVLSVSHGFVIMFKNSLILANHLEARTLICTLKVKRF